MDDSDEQTVAFALRRRGIACGPPRHDGVLVPRGATAQERWFRLLRKYSFRIFVRDLIRLRDGADVHELARYCTPETARAYAAETEALRLTRWSRGRVYLRARDVVSFGPTLEWFVAQVLRREFGMAAACTLRLQGTPTGGDYDVIAVAEGTLIYVEVKAAPPRNIDQNNIAAFVNRVSELSPDVAILLNDTQLRMLDKLVPAVRTELQRHGIRRPIIAPVERQIFGIRDRLFITNSEPDLIGNLGVCLARYFRRRGSGCGQASGCDARSKRRGRPP